ncbi:cell division topological specificity factor MinE [Blochmannia endosymbiont of Camponotus modoc]|uniref:cell division topological specificity factor MinE n=1 Tax=Blochmannia endosymbiont of Camponotus modoc TaxID=2945587 RepID=UPI0020253068|nr:cell division topological specificity factor MinE [Blochmannia endosymbiont of Camponotus modoc]URJ29582.1 cell division topological specificity factor MinE [Blochmannia endosymbiont of Camponotus modoc]URJ31610.1 cell division topological specificity factor MinE [Blochmannia endosymbiont of Camponotus modoc]
MVLVNFFFFRKKTPANIAKKRLQEIISEHNIRNNFTPYFLPQLKKDLVQTISKYIHNPRILSIQLEKKDNNTSILKCKIIFFNEETQ